MDLLTTLIALAAAGLVFAFARRQDRKERLPGNVTLIPYTMIQIFAVVTCLVLLAHLVTLVSGVPFKGRFAG
ncbi:hypothetical protein NUH88_07095 [Nisaea acidiphila]|uniref:Uncharacterized protein n=1 Tax=Nisaea acidiphila TaxID=1862145 RepID=A0A9J7AVT8_9PROT|nr:hypothetical protein [Nisaea acidiphila]UUX51455.1 hypothetical protein NUH88_07095 [Nisaea acidiphila]